MVYYAPLRRFCMSQRAFSGMMHCEFFKVLYFWLHALAVRRLVVK